MYRITYSKNTIKFFKKHKEAREQFSKISKLFKNNPYTTSLDIRPLSWKHLWMFRLRVWKYRIIYQIHNSEVEIFLIDAWSRWDMYK